MNGLTDGAGRYLNGLLTALGRRDDVAVSAVVGPSVAAPAAAIPGLERILALPGRAAPGRLLSQHTLTPVIARRWGADAVLYTGNYLPLWPGPNAVAIVQNLLLAMPTNEYGRARAVYRRWMRDHIARRAGIVATLSRFAATELERAAPSVAGLLEVVHPGVDVEFFGAHAEPPRCAPQPYFLAVGTAWAYRDYPLAIDALSQSGLPQHLVIVGEVPPDRRTELEEHARQRGLRDCLHLPGVLAAQEVRRWYAGADALLATSRTESFALPVVEAMAAGVPVVAAARTVFPETVGDAGLLARPTSPALADALERSVAHDERARLIAAGVRRAREFTWERCADRLVELCRRLRTRRARAGGPR
jgi:glycosyltransferase involved in cell wall biosynthesis